jgi:hypothetical protein
VVQARGLGYTSLVVDSYGRGDLLGSEEAKGVMFEFQAVTDLVDLEAQEMVFADPVASGSLGMVALSLLADQRQEMLQPLTCGHRWMIRSYHPTCEPGKSWIRRSDWQWHW